MLLDVLHSHHRRDPSSLGGFEANSFSFSFFFCSQHAWLPATSAWWTIFNPPVLEQLWCGATQRADNSSGAHSKSQLCQQTLIILLHFEPACISHCAYCCLPSDLECLCQRRRTKPRPVLPPAADDEPKGGGREWSFLKFKQNKKKDKLVKFWRNGALIYPSFPPPAVNFNMSSK